MANVLREITSITDNDCFYIVERHKSEFTFPIHSHEEFELNFIEGGRGVRRVVGDSIETIGDFELTLVTGDGLEHAWEQGGCREKDIREITIQFSPRLLDDKLLSRNQFASIRKMFERARMGLTFSMPAIMRVYCLLDTLATKEERMDQFLDMLRILYELSLDTGARTLASNSFAKTVTGRESRRVNKVKEFIAQHYTEEIKLDDLAGLVAMSPSAFSRFFKQYTGRGPVDYIIDVRMGVAARMLVDTTTSVSEICYACGFNNLSNFNRTFKARRGYTPRDFRALFTKNRIYV
ncbi:MAG: helix-turn-helix transcriptional regulator [Bacteroidales bacterium]|jgi:AraC-like DNA-binding protein|nr:helix-turn-helix transcriptional regulator [Bacteroidales bacterium]MBQ1753851.1 helix-turn-helix transcriptional regulator [Bacteroidales bacterium]MBQ2194409.1 helix-turn-helix transcriptional regulator [Bacteroidales bacterium]MBQ5517881.1 helix-turn-helix transcriptional regulator [Bacteroidales bacterium]MBQ5528967.1 helix-turn-helix transcriptional regulator [Bacteroidales bacterium]